MLRYFVATAVAALAFSLAAQSIVHGVEQPTADPSPLWPAISREARPGAYWWWMGSAVDPDNLTRELERYRAAGMGGVHIIPIYGAKGYESRYIECLSPQWMAMLQHAVREAERLDMFVDMTTGSGWCFGGPNLAPDDVCALVDVQTLMQQPSQCPVKRAGPGGDGPMLNPYYEKAIRHYLERFTDAFANYQGPKPRAMYHDSFEYNSNWSPDLLDEFAKRRGYRLEEHRQLLLGKDSSDHAARVKSDYRETISDMMIDNYIAVWVEWCHDQGLLTRNQAHGSPANLLDLYALSDIPETEMFNRDRSVLVSKMASSAAHVAGRKLVSSETGTWLKEHFTETLADVKDLVDLLFVSGVNHIQYHGTCYSPDDADWPGWLFYASTEMNPRNPIWRDVPALNAYVARCQSVLQAGCSDNDILLYWPIHDLWHNAGVISIHHSAGLAERLTVHDRAWFETQPVGNVSKRLWDRGYTFDFISDRQINASRVADRQVMTPGGHYQTVLIPPCRRMPLSTLSALFYLATEGATIAFVDGMPQDVPGAGDLENRRNQLKGMLKQLEFVSIPSGIRRATLGKGRIIVGALEDVLVAAKVQREAMTDQQGLMLIRRSLPDGHYYFLAHRGQKPMDGWMPLGVEAESAVIMDPMTGCTGIATFRRVEGGMPEIYLQLESGASVIVRTFAHQTTGTPWPYRRSIGEPIEVTGTWQVKFIEGGPELPPPSETRQLTSWTKFGGAAAERFAGTACYTITFDAPVMPASAWSLDLGEVCQSARVKLNGEDLGTVFVRPFRVPLKNLQPMGNVLEIEVTNVAANRIRDMDRRGIPWKVFHDINFVDMDYQAFNASQWPIRDSGLLGPVRLLRQELFTP